MFPPGLPPEVRDAFTQMIVLYAFYTGLILMNYPSFIENPPSVWDRPPWKDGSFLLAVVILILVFSLLFWR